MKNFNEKSCEICKTPYTPTGSSSKYCKPCAVEKAKANGRRNMMECRRRKGMNVGVGRGMANATLEADDQFRTGISWFQKNRRRLRDEIRCCERCSLDLLNAGRYMWVIHHIDHDRTHNVRSNLQLLCKRCHQIEHDCHKAFEGVTTNERQAP